MTEQSTIDTIEIDGEPVALDAATHLGGPLPHHLETVLAEDKSRELALALAELGHTVGVHAVVDEDTDEVVDVCNAFAIARSLGGTTLMLDAEGLHGAEDLSNRWDDFLVCLVEDHVEDRDVNTDAVEGERALEHLRSLELDVDEDVRAAARTLDGWAQRMGVFPQAG